MWSSHLNISSVSYHATEPRNNSAEEHILIEASCWIDEKLHTRRIMLCTRPPCGRAELEFSIDLQLNIIFALETTSLQWGTKSNVIEVRRTSQTVVTHHIKVQHLPPTAQHTQCAVHRNQTSNWNTALWESCWMAQKWSSLMWKCPILPWNQDEGEWISGSTVSCRQSSSANYLSNANLW